MATIFRVAMLPFYKGFSLSGGGGGGIISCLLFTSWAQEFLISPVDERPHTLGRRHAAFAAPARVTVNYNGDKRRPLTTWPMGLFLPWPRLIGRPWLCCPPLGGSVSYMSILWKQT